MPAFSFLSGPPQPTSGRVRPKIDIEALFHRIGLPPRCIALAALTMALSGKTLAISPRGGGYW